MEDFKKLRGPLLFVELFRQKSSCQGILFDRSKIFFFSFFLLYIRGRDILLVSIKIQIQSIP